MKQSLITFLTSLGSGLEYYDFVIYIIFASFIGENFFPGTDKVAVLFATFGVYAISNIIRPLGGIILGIYGDRLGRKKIFGATLIYMAVATFIMGITPTFATIGITATILFTVCRIVQGITCGAELPGATTYLLEHTQNNKRRGLHFGFMVSAVGVGSSFALFIAWLLTKLLNNEQMLSWGFRLPFLLGGMLAIVGFLVRREAPETPSFLAVEGTKNQFSLVFTKKHMLQIIKVIGMLIFPASCITFFLAVPVYLHDIYKYSFADVYLAMTIGTLWSSLLIPIFGWFTDVLSSRKTLFIITIVIFVVFSVPVFSLLSTTTIWALFVFVLFGKTIIAALAASYFVLLPLAFSTVTRYSGTSISYNIAYSLVALLPMGMNYVYGVLQQPQYMPWIFIFLGLISFISVRTLIIEKHF